MSLETQEILDGNLAFISVRNRVKFEVFQWNSWDRFVIYYLGDITKIDEIKSNSATYYLITSGYNECKVFKEAFINKISNSEVDFVYIIQN